MERFGSWLCIHSGLLARIFKFAFELLDFHEAIQISMNQIKVVAAHLTLLLNLNCQEFIDSCHLD